MNMIDYVNEDYTIIVNDELARREIMKRHPLAKVMLSNDDAIGGKGLLIDPYAQDGLGVKAAKAKFSERNIVIRRFTKEFVEGNNDKSEDTLELETDKAKELQKYSEQIAKAKEDFVNHPSHYNQYSQEVIDTIEEVTVNMPVTVAYHVGNAVKYLFRAPFKGKLKQDLEKAVWYLERAVSKL